ncbi:putative conserved small protein [Leptolyngbya boryana NIES-2135]|jgi:predicted XRE-type DNA-binding protein|uniref:Putative conserved small protein n=1 Tax=Leptolyngbya boryana NIES-2135 TaxID=1973484 RepID=A0A1Z4JHU7_LEPBY|nr:MULTISPECIES: XRE family transcriptional regulator [Leptolyngbya]BAY56319.1 putative conserved small protein [Leptolyngbya boryana NIES-2135]MBD1854954.1 XRE family transcriptional regulator [Leptolyngbya sp. FACHB-1624]MBD2366426.1 XRE family transcriptional regulator [Leptolyngbya sp. FACHB-161]MBD2372605.1 XRE family transcriptional regulator [Leptolyngbya sp. FACHB-238]MBD2397028.1 XRE family transcriptional regulator [Leptolyngbya sp. FACHB-239]
MTDNLTTIGEPNVFVDLGFPPQEAEELRIRADLMLNLKTLIQDRNWTIDQASQILGESPDTIQALLQGKIGQFRIDQLILMLTRAGMTIRIEVLPNVA